MKYVRSEEEHGSHVPSGSRTSQNIILFKNLFTKMGGAKHEPTIISTEFIKTGSLFEVSSYGYILVYMCIPFVIQ